MADDQTAQDLTPDDNGVTLNSDQIMELLRRAHDATPPKPISPPKSPFQAVQQPSRPQIPQVSPQQPMQGPPANQPQPGKVLDQASGAYVSPQTAQNVAWTRQRGDELNAQDQAQEKADRVATGQQNTWQQIYAALRKQNPQATPQQLLMSMKAYKDAGAFETYAKNALGKTVEEQVYASVLQSTGDRDAAEKAAAQYKAGGSLDEIQARKAAMSGGTEEGKKKADIQINKPKAEEKLEDMNSSMDNTIKFIGMARKQVSGMTTGMGSMLSGIPGSSAKDLDSTVQTIKSNIGFDKLQTMKDESPTGSALGRVTNMEIQLLQNVVANLDTSQSQDQFKLHLDIAEEEVKKAKKRIADAYDLTYGSGGAEAAESMLGKSDNSSSGESSSGLPAGWSVKIGK